MNTVLVICMGTNAVSRKEAARSLRFDVDNIIDSDDPDLIETKLGSYGLHTRFRAMIQYFHQPSLTVKTYPARWWNEIADQIERDAPSVARKGEAKANINRDTGGGFLMFTWESITGEELASFCHSLTRIIG